MDLFKDKAYEDLDDISQLVEPYEFTINNQIAQLPDEIVLDADYFASVIRNNSGRDSAYDDLRKIVQRQANKLNLKELAEHSRLEYQFSKEFFKIEMDENVTFNPATNELIGDVKIIKTKVAYEDKDIDKMLLDHMKKEFSNKLGRPSNMNKGRMNEICDLFGIPEALSDRKAMGKLNKLYAKYKELMSDRTMNIRDVELFKRFVNWNVKYIKDGNLPAMSNITKVKIMMRNELPIYSIKEDEV